MRKILIAMAAAGFTTLAACSRLSPEAKMMVGRYYIPEVSEKVPLLNLRKDGCCTVTKVVPGVVTFSVEGRWDVRNDSLVARLTPETLDVEGDTALVGEVPESMAFRIAKFNDVSLTIERNGINYTYHRRPN